MGKGLGFQQQQCYGDDGMRMDIHGYSYHEDSWGSDNMNMMKIKPSGANYAIEYSHCNNINKLGGNHGMLGETMPNNYAHHGGGINKLGSATHSYSHHQFSNGGANKFDSGGHHGRYNFEEYKQYNEEHRGIERHNYGGGNHGFHANPYGHGGYKGEWIAKGV